MKKMVLNIFLVLAALVTVGISVWKEVLSDRQRDADNSQILKSQHDYNLLSQKYRDDILAKQAELKLINEKHQAELLLAQEKYNLLNQKYITESGIKVAKGLIGEDSKPRLQFVTCLREKSIGYISLGNYYGSDPAYDVQGYLANIYIKDDPFKKSVRFGPVTIPSKTNLSDMYGFEMDPEKGAWLSARFHSRRGEYFQEIIVAHDGSQFRQVTCITDLKSETIEYDIDPLFPFEKSEAAQTWRNQAKK